MIILQCTIQVTLNKHATKLDIFNTPSKPSGHHMYHQFNIQQFHVLPHTLYLCVLYGSQNKQRLFLYTALTDWFLYQRQSVFTVRYRLDIYI